jgi:hypothetical protein
MPKATVATASGSKVTIEGTDDEIVALVARIEGLGQAPRGRSPSSSGPKPTNKTKPTLTGLISEMITAGFFKEPKHLGALKAELEQNGQFYPLTTLSPAMLRLVRSRQLRRIKDARGRWCYVG